MSTEEQASEGESLKAQEQELRARCEREGWTVHRVYTDAGVSGRLESRPALDRIVADAEGGKLDAVIVWKLDRLGRTQRQLHQNAGRLKDAGVSLIAMRDNIDTGAIGGQALFGVLAIGAEMESNNISTRVKSAFAQHRAKGLHDGTKYGWRLEDGVLIVNPSEAEVVRRAYAEWSAGRRQAEIARTLELL